MGKLSQLDKVMVNLAFISIYKGYFEKAFENKKI